MHDWISIYITLESSSPSRLAKVYGMSVLIAGDCCSTDAFLLKSSAVNSLRKVQKRSAPLSITVEATRKVIVRSDVLSESALSDAFVTDFDVLEIWIFNYKVILFQVIIKEDRTT